MYLQSSKLQLDCKNIHIKVIKTEYFIEFFLSLIVDKTSFKYF